MWNSLPFKALRGLTVAPLALALLLPLWLVPPTVVAWASAFELQRNLLSVMIALAALVFSPMAIMIWGSLTFGVSKVMTKYYAPGRWFGITAMALATVALAVASVWTVAGVIPVLYCLLFTAIVAAGVAVTWLEGE